MEKAKAAVVWSGIEVVLKQGLQLGFSIALARLLAPEEFGTIALLFLFSGIGAAFVDGGLSAALIQKQDVTRADESTVFWFNLGMGVLVALALWAAAPLIAGFFGVPALVSLTGVMALNIILGALGSIHGTLLNKRLDFRIQMKISVLATVCSGTVAVVLAWKGFGVWALAVQIVTATTLTTILLWLVNSWRPAGVFSLASARRLFGFGGYLLASQILAIAYSRVYTLLIGKLFSPRDLGFYERANSTQQLPAALLSIMLGRVSLPIFSEAAQERDRLVRGVRLALRGVMLVNVPAMFGLAATAEPLVLVLFGAKWLPAVPLLQILCIGGIFWPLHGLNLSALTAQGHSRLYFRLEVVKVVVGVGFLVGGSFFGVTGIAWSVGCFGAVGFVINAHYTKRYLGYGAGAQFRDILPIIAAAVPMALGVYYLGQAWTAPAWLLLLTQVTVGVVSFLVISWVSGLTAMRDAVALFRRRKTAGA